MPNHALVVGVAHYDDRSVPQLGTPVDDALRMAAWLLDPAGGNVPVDNLILLLTPTPPLSPAPPGVDLSLLSRHRNLLPATQENLRAAPLEIEARAGKGGDRLFVYYAGHGLQARITFSNEDALVPSDYRPGVHNAVSVSSLIRFFQATPFREQYFFFDCCRNLLEVDETELDDFRPNKPGLDHPPWDQFILNATAPGLKALEGRGFLTDVLLAGLAGAGTAKRWATEQKQYIVRLGRLFAYLTERFDAMPAETVVGAVGATPVLQRPRLGGESSHDPVLAMLPEGAFPAVNLDVVLTPVLALPAAQARIALVGHGARVDPTTIGQSPFRFALKPRTYALTLHAAPLFDVGEGTWFLDVYDAMRWPFELRPSGQPAPVPGPGPASAPAPPPSASAPPAASDAVAVPISLFRGVPGSVAGPVPAAATLLAFAPPASGPPPEPGHLIVTADDPMAPLELLDDSGATLHDARGRPLLAPGRLDCPGLAPGIYRARMRTPEGKAAEQVIHLAAGQDLEVKLEAPRCQAGGLLQEIIDRAQLLLRPDNLIEFSERVGAVAAPALSTILSVASSAAKHGGAGLQALGLRSLAIAQAEAELPAGSIEVVLAAERMAGTLDQPDKVREYLKGVEVRCWPLNGTPGPVRHPDLAATPGLATLGIPADPGAYWVWARSAAGPSAAFAVVVLDGHTTRMIFHQEADGQIHVTQFLPDKEANPILLRALDLAERFLERGQCLPALAALQPLLAARPIDPIAGCLAGHLLIRGHRTEELGRLAESLVEWYPGLPDAHVLRGRYRELTSQTDAARADYQTALDRGLPIVAAHLRNLADGVRRTHLEHPRAELLSQMADRSIAGLLWSAWTPVPGWPDTAASLRPLKSAPSADPGDSSSPITQGVQPVADLTPHPVPQTPSSPPLPPPQRGYCQNQPNGGPLIPSQPATIATATRAMADTARLWPNGKTLNVSFLNGDDAWGQVVRQAIRQIAPVWCAYANLKFVFDQPTAHVAVNLVPYNSPQGPVGFGTYRCFIGLDCLNYFKQGLPSMDLLFPPNLISDPALMQEEFTRVIRHEFGHAIGLIHEHQRPDRPIHWNEQKLSETFGGSPNYWTIEQIRAQIESFYKDGPTVGTAFDIHSIMMYQFPQGAAFYENGTPFESPNNTTLSPMDKVLANMLYPATGVTDPDEGALIPGEPAVSGTIQVAGQVARYRVPVTAAGIYSIDTQGPDPLLVSVLDQRREPAGQLLAVEGANVSLAFRAVNSGKDYFVEVRHANPLTGTGSFSIAIRQQA